VGLVSGFAAGIGGTLVYLFGRGGRRLFPKLGSLFPEMGDGSGFVSRWTSRIVGWAQRRGSIVVFVMSAVFNPLFAPMAIAMGTLRFRLFKFFLMCWAGNTVKSMFVAYCGYFGLGSLLRWLGISV
jgi:membrane protein DedA with SNARE-associated domain